MIAALLAAAAIHAAPKPSIGKLQVGSPRPALTWRPAPGTSPGFSAYPYLHPEDQDLTVFGAYHSVTICPSDNILLSSPPQLACQRWDRETGKSQGVFCDTAGGNCR